MQMQKLDYNDLVALGKRLGKASANPAMTYSVNGQSLTYSAMNATFSEQLRLLGGSWADYRENKNTIFSMMEEIVSDVLPKKVEKRYEQLAEVKVLNNNDAIKFRRKTSNNSRAKQFITRVGRAGVYETFKLAKNEEVFEVPTSAIGGAVQIGIEEFMDGRADLSELLEIILEGMDELIYKEVAYSLKSSINQLPAANRAVSAGFDEALMDRLVMIASAYGNPVIYCTKEFAVNMIPSEAWRYTENMKAELWEQGRLSSYKSTPVVILEQGFEDETNSRKVIDPGFAWVIPATAKSKPVMIGMNGPTIIDEYDNRDRSKEIQVYKKVGVVTMFANDVCAYIDTALAGKMDTWSFSNNNIKDYTGTVHA